MKEMVFTDGDLVRLKQELNKNTDTIAIWAPCLQALIERLDAAERATLACQSDFCCNTQEFKTWRKVTGKGV